MEDKSIYDLWALLISRKSAGTARSYADALNRFTKDNGERVQWNDIDADFVRKWRQKMLSVLSRTTTNIYLRSLSALLNVAFKENYLSIAPRELFQGLGIFSPTASNSRKSCYIPRRMWYELWEFYQTKGKSVFTTESEEQKSLCVESAGLMLFMYLAGGMNLRDLCLLRYNRFYFQSGATQFQFCRHKTAERTEMFVELPILPEMHTILSRLANQPKEGKLVFPYMISGVGNEEKEHTITMNIGSMIRKRMKVVAQLLNWPVIPTPTWARHSFATNLIQAGVPKEYVSWAMAHASSDVTSRYIAAYSFEQTVEFHSLLLYPKQTTDHLMRQIEMLKSEEQWQLLQELQEYLQTKKE